MSTGAQPYEDHTVCKYGLCALNAHTHREDIPLISTEKCGFPPRVSLGIRLPSFKSHGPQQATKEPETEDPPHLAVKCPMLSLKNTFSLPPSGLIFFPFLS